MPKPKKRRKKPAPDPIVEKMKRVLQAVRIGMGRKTPRMFLSYEITFDKAADTLYYRIDVFPYGPARKTR